MPRMTKEQYADIWATIKAMRVEEMEGLLKRVANELQARKDARQAKVEGKPLLGVTASTGVNLYPTREELQP